MGVNTFKHSERVYGYSIMFWGSWWSLGLLSESLLCIWFLPAQCFLVLMYRIEVEVVFGYLWSFLRCYLVRNYWIQDLDFPLFWDITFSRKSRSVFHDSFSWYTFRLIWVGQLFFLPMRLVLEKRLFYLILLIRKAWAAVVVLVMKGRSRTLFVAVWLLIWRVNHAITRLIIRALV